MAFHNQLTYLLNVANMETILTNVSKRNVIFNSERRLENYLPWAFNKGQKQKELGEMRQRVSLVRRELGGGSVSEIVTKLVCIHIVGI